jgi:predicted transcriptional regulator
MKVTVSTTYDIIRLIKDNEDYGMTKCGKIVNIKRAKLIKKTFSGMSKGYYLNSKFIHEHEIKTIPIPTYCPF